MKALAELLPLIAFFVGYQAGGDDIFAATAALMVSAPAMLVVLKVAGHPIEPFHRATVLMILLFGGLTLALRESAFIQWKPTVLYLAFAIALFVSARFLSKNLVRMLLNRMLELEERDWGTLSDMWSAFFLFMAALNAALVLGLEEATWVTVRTFGYPTLTLVFCLAQGVFIHLRMVRAKSAGGASRPHASAESAAQTPPGPTR